MRSKVWYWLCLVFPLFLDCSATIPLASSRLDDAGKSFRAAENKANIYVARGRGISGSGLLFQVFLNGQLATALAPGTYLLSQVEPGDYTISVITKESQDSVTLEVAAESNFFFEIAARPGLTEARAKVKRLDDSAGKTLVSKARRALPLNADTISSTLH